MYTFYFKTTFSCLIQINVSLNFLCHNFPDKADINGKVKVSAILLSLETDFLHVPYLSNKVLDNKCNQVQSTDVFTCILCILCKHSLFLTRMTRGAANMTAETPEKYPFFAAVPQSEKSETHSSLPS